MAAPRANAPTSITAPTTAQDLPVVIRCFANQDRRTLELSCERPIRSTLVSFNSLLDGFVFRRNCVRSLGKRGIMPRKVLLGPLAPLLRGPPRVEVLQLRLVKAA